MRAYLKLCLAYLAVFEVARLLFLGVNYHASTQLTLVDIIKTFAYGLRLDLSVTAYCMLLPTLFLSLRELTQWHIMTPLIKAYVYLSLFLISLISVTDALLYGHWGFRLDLTPLFYLQHPKEAMASSTTTDTLIFWTLFLSLLSSYIMLFRRWVFPALHLPYLIKNIKKAIGYVLLIGVLIIPIRGGLQQIPINVGSVYFSTKNYANHVAINVCWNLAFAFTKRNELAADYHFMSAERATQINQALNASRTAPSVLRQTRPNVILVMLESFTANVVEAVGGEPNITPNLNALAHEGILFNNMYAAGDRTEKGIAAILSGYPTLPTSSVFSYANKSAKLSSLIQDFKQMAYPTAFYYGGESDFANMKAYLLSQQVEENIDKKDFPANSYNSKWGAYDHYVFNRVFADCQKDAVNGKPFFKAIMTLTSHEPFEVPMETVIQGNDEANLFRNSVVYADRSLGDFVRQCKAQPWWDNTLIIFVADHGHRLPLNLANHELQKFRIPMIWVGGALAVRDTVVNTLCSQTDIAPTLLAQLNQPNTQYVFGKNIFAAEQPHAFYAFNNGFGYVSPRGKLVYDLNGNTILQMEGDTSKLVLEGKACLQALGQDFNQK